jgi:molybdate transport system substrate-binding protein
MKAIILTLLLLISLGYTQTLYIASASSMRPFVEEAKKLFERENPGIEVKVSYGSSGNLYRQILGGAPYDIFLSANELYPEKLSAKGFASKPVVFAFGRLTLFSLKLEVKDIDLLERVDRVAIANPRHAPYGRAALEFIRREGLYPKLRGKLIYGSNVAQAFQFVVSGGAQAGIVSYSLVLHYGKGSYKLIPSSKHSPVRHTACITKEGRGKEHSRRFINFLLSDKVKELLIEKGFEVP